MKRKTKKLRTLLLDVWQNKVEELPEFEDGLQNFYDKLNCDLIEIVYLTIGGKEYVVVCDEEALLKEEVKISAIDNLGNAVVTGSLMFFNDTPNGEFGSLTDEDTANLKSRIQTMATRKYPDGYLMLTGVEYA